MLINQTKENTNKPSFLIATKRTGTLVSNKIYNHFLKIVLKEYEVGGNHDGIFYTTMEEIKQTMNLGKTNNKQIWAAIEQLQTTQIKMTGFYNKRDRYDRKSFVLLGSAQASIMKGLIEFSMDKIFLNFLMELKENDTLLYAKLEDKFIKDFKLKHSLVLYEFFKDFAGQKRINMTEQELRELLNLENKYNSYDFNRYGIKKSIDEINKKTTLKIKYKIETEIDRSNAKPEKKNIFKFIIEDLSKIKDKEKVNLTALKKTILHFWETERKYSFPSLELKDIGIRQDKKSYKIYLTSENEDLNPTEAKQIWQYLFSIFIDKSEINEEKQEILCKSFNITKKEFFEEYERNKRILEG